MNIFKIFIWILVTKRMPYIVKMKDKYNFFSIKVNHSFKMMEKCKGGNLNDLLYIWSPVMCCSMALTQEILKSQTT